jgi:predicted DNA binding CopG/RHH family protein
MYKIMLEMWRYLRNPVSSQEMANENMRSHVTISCISEDMRAIKYGYSLIYNGLPYDFFNFMIVHK